MQQCPVCETEYIEGTTKECSKCKWDVTLHNSTLEPWELAQLKTWAKNRWEEIQELQHNRAEESQDKKRVTLAVSELLRLEEKLDNFREEFQEERQQTTAKIDKLQQQVLQLQEALDKGNKERSRFEKEIEKKLKKRSETRTDSDLENLSSEITASPVSKISAGYDKQNTEFSPKKVEYKTLSEEEQQLVNAYNDASKYKSDLSYNITVVSATDESIEARRIDTSKPLVLERVGRRKGNYWIINIEDNNYLVPKVDIRINSHSLTTVEALFKCAGSQSGESRDFQLVKPGKISSNMGDRWELVERGVLDFESSEQEEDYE